MQNRTTIIVVFVLVFVVIIGGLLYILLNAAPSAPDNNDAAEYAAAVGAANNAETAQYIDLTQDTFVYNRCRKDCKGKYCFMGYLGVSCPKAADCLQNCTNQFLGNGDSATTNNTPSPNTIKLPSKNK